MTTAERSNYFSKRWPAACRAQHWDHRDQALRRRVVLECMRRVRGPAITTSDPRWGRDETSALFCYLDFLAHQDNLDKSARWVDCQVDYRAFNRAKQADYYEGRAYGHRGSKRLRKERFAGRQTAAGEPLESFDPEEIKKRFVTMASRAQKKERAERAAAKRDILENPPAPRVIVLTPAADFDDAAERSARHEPEPAYVPPDDEPF